MDTSWHPDKCSRLFGERTKIKNDKHGVLYRSDKLCDKWDYMNIFLQAKLLPVKLDTCHRVLYVLLNEMMHCSWSHFGEQQQILSPPFDFHKMIRFTQELSPAIRGFGTVRPYIFHDKVRCVAGCCGWGWFLFEGFMHVVAAGWTKFISRTLGFVAKWKGSKGNSRSLDCGSSSTFRNYSMLIERLMVNHMMRILWLWPYSWYTTVCSVQANNIVTLFYEKLGITKLLWARFAISIASLQKWTSRGDQEGFDKSPACLTVWVYA